MDIAIPDEADGWNGPAVDTMFRDALELLARQAGGRIVIPARAVLKSPDGTLAFAFVGDDGDFLELAFVRHSAPDGVGREPLAVDAEQQESANVRFGLTLVVIEAGGRLRLSPFDLEAAAVAGVLTFGTETNGDYTITFTQTEN